MVAGCLVQRLALPHVARLVSAAFLAACCGVWLQGIGSYNSSPLFADRTCYYFDSAAATLAGAHGQPGNPRYFAPVERFSCGFVDTRDFSRAAAFASVCVYDSPATAEAGSHVRLVCPEVEGPGGGPGVGDDDDFNSSPRPTPAPGP